MELRTLNFLLSIAFAFLRVIFIILIIRTGFGSFFEGPAACFGGTAARFGGPRNTFSGHPSDVLAAGK